VALRNTVLKNLKSEDTLDHNNQILIDKDDLESILQKVKEVGCDTSFYIRHVAPKPNEDKTADFEIEIPHKVKGIFGFFTFRV
jgi:hypothetical protein